MRSYLSALVIGTGLAVTATSIATIPSIAVAETMPSSHIANVQGGISLPETQHFIEDLSVEAIEKLATSGLTKAEQKARLADLLEENFALDKISRFVLGRYWRVATPAQQQRFSRLFRQNIIEAYGDRLQDYGGQQVQMMGGRLTSNGKFSLVDTLITDPNGPSVNVQWRVAPVNGRYQIADVVVEGVSLGATQREEFAAAIARNGGSIDAFLSSLEKQTAKAGIVIPKTP